MNRVDYLIIGGGLAGANAAAAIRENDKNGTIVIVTDENHIPYDRVPLSKNYLLGKMKREVLHVKKQDFYISEKIQVVSGRKAVNLDPENHTVKIDDGTEYMYKKLLLATGGRVRKLVIQGSELNGVFYLRTVDDAESIMHTIERSRTAVVIGGGFIGCELAATFSKRDIVTTIIEAGPKILGRAFDSDTAGWIESYLEGKGVKIMTKTMPAELVGNNGKVTGVKLQSGRVIPADFVVIGIGIVPNVELAEDAGLQVDNGIMVNEYLQTSHPDIYAASDVARFYSSVFGRYMRLEHYDLAVRQGRLAGENMTGRSKPFDELPYFFSFMFAIRIEAYGDLSKYDTVVTRGNPSENGNFTKFYLDNGIVNAAVMVTRKENVEAIKHLICMRKKIGNPSSLGNESDKIEVAVT